MNSCLIKYLGVGPFSPFRLFIQDKKSLYRFGLIGSTTYSENQKKEVQLLLTLVDDFCKKPFLKTLFSTLIYRFDICFDNRLGK